MCGRFTLRTPAHLIARHFNLSAQTEWQTALRYNIAPTQEVAVIRAVGQGRELRQMRWGLIPSWAADPKIGYSMINARCETAAERPAFRSAIKSRRCLIPADGFYEWRTVGKQKQPNYFRRPDDQPFAFAGLWEQWSKQGEPIESCTILTTAANDLVKPLHERMPLILTLNDYDAWLNPNTTEVAKLIYLFEPSPVDELTLYPVNPIVNNVRNEGAECAQPV